MRNFELAQALEILHATPPTLRSLLGRLSDPWTRSESRERWGPVDVLGHLIVGEETDWIERTRIMLTHGTSKPFEPFNREGQFGGAPRTIAQLLDDFRRLRTDNLAELSGFGLDDEKLESRGLHPEFGEVRLRDMLATWAVHDLAHIAQIAETMAKRYYTDVGPWRRYLPMLEREDLPG